MVLAIKWIKILQVFERLFSIFERKNVLWHIRVLILFAGRKQQGL
jgi:hypothetical protein